MERKIVTIGVYGFEEEAFFQALRGAGVDTFCDLRERRGMRGARYAFANRARLEKRLGEMGICYLHFKELAPTRKTRRLQKDDDRERKTAKREREQMAGAFRLAYTVERLTNFDAEEFWSSLGPEACVAALFCVERDPEACHRSLVAEKLARDLSAPLEHLRP
jgi:uncharacterized protein (DUF488 family)